MSGVRKPGDDDCDESESESESESVSKSDSVMPANMSTLGLVTSAIFTSSVFSSLLLRKDKEEMRLSDIVAQVDFAPSPPIDLAYLCGCYFCSTFTRHSLNHSNSLFRDFPILNRFAN